MIKAIACLLAFIAPAMAFASESPGEKTGRDGALMVYVEEGPFVMGTDEEDIGVIAPKHNVYLSAFYMDKYEVTNEMFAGFLNAARPAEGRDAVRDKWIVLRSDLSRNERADWWPTEIVFENGGYSAFQGFERFPVLSVSWEAADAYCKWAGRRLPTEAEWEKAARGGLKEKNFPWGNELPTGALVYEREWKSNEDPPPTEAVGNYPPNALGIYDMAGNVWEWCSDWFHPGYYYDSPNRNPKGPDTGFEKVLRGGSWISKLWDLRVANRNYSPPFSADDAVGFRCAMDAAAERNEK